MSAIVWRAELAPVPAAEPDMARAQHERHDKHVWVWAGAALLLAGLAAAGFVLPLKEWTEGFQQWIEGFGPWGAVIFALAYVLAVVLLLPAGPLTIAAGLAFGAWALPLVVVAATIGAVLAFLVARYIAGAKVQKLIEHRRNWRAVNKAVSEDGWKIVALLRLSPVVPFSLQNYALGLSEIPLLSYFTASLVGIVPGTLMYVYLGALGQQSGGKNAAEWAIYGVGFVATVLATVLITRKAKAELKKAGVGKK